MTDKINLGKTPNEYDGRDAVHIAVCPGIASQTLKPGQHIGFVDKAKGIFGPSSNNIGVVSPFYLQPISAKSRFWVLLYPNTISSLRHVWEHSEFIPEVKPTKPSARLEIEKIADGLGVDPDELIRRAEKYQEYGDYWCGGEDFEGLYLPLEFWDYYEEVKNCKVPEEDKHSFFSCAC